MVESKYSCNTGTYEINWTELYPRLHAFARCLVYRYRISCWYGQEEEVADDVTQETARRLIERQQKAARGEAAPIELAEPMMVAIAHNYILDLVRRERKVIRLPIEELTPTMKHRENYCMQMEEVAIENANKEWLFLQLAHAIAHFPNKRRRVLLIDIANRMCFDEEPTPLQAAFLAVGIDLQAYQVPVPIDAVERSRYASLLCLAYTSLEHLASMQEDMQVA